MIIADTMTMSGSSGTLRFRALEEKKPEEKKPGEKKPEEKKP
jgi:hypothetical protein